MKRFQPYFYLLKPVSGHFIIAILAGLIAGAAGGFGLPFMIREVFPLIFRSEETGVVADSPQWLLAIMQFFGAETLEPSVIVLWACMMLPMVFVIRGIFGYINTYFINYSGLFVLEQIRLKAYDRLQRLPLAFHHRHKEGDLLARVMNDTSQIQMALTRIASDAIIQPITLLSALGSLIYLAMKDDGVVVILASLCSVPLCVFPIRMLGKKMLKKARHLQKKSGDMTASLTENLASQREVRAYNMEDEQVQVFERDSILFRKFRMKVVKYRYLISPLVEIISAVGIGFTIYLGAQRGMTYEVFIPIISAMFVAYEPIKKLGNISANLKQAEASLERIEEILLATDSMPEPTAPEKFEGINGNVRFNNVSFSYGENPDLSGIDLAVPPGQIVALVGPSGAGKSTFVSLIPRFYEVSQGALEIDGVDVRNVSKHDLRDQIALVSQHPLLFSGSIAQNILIGRPEASEEEMIAAAKHANAHDFIMSFPEGYQTIVGERGEGLSGGQRQRVAIARAFLKDAPILILDEATSALDTESESQIQEALKELSKGRTTFLIAHRFSSIRDAERILVFDKTEQGGQIIADGSHEGLYESCKLYKDLYDKQNG